RSRRSRSSRVPCAAAGRGPRSRCSSRPRGWSSPRSHSSRGSVTRRRSPFRCPRSAHAGAGAAGTPGCASSPRTDVGGQGLVLVVVDGLTPSVFEHAVETGAAPTLSFLAEHGRYARATSTFPSLTPVCASSIATGAHPDVHHVPHLVWFDRDARRVVEYGSSFGALVAAGTRRSIVDTIFN